jgi:hypothetical protein
MSRIARLLQQPVSGFSRYPDLAIIVPVRSVLHRESYCSFECKSEPITALAKTRIIREGEEIGRQKKPPLLQTC